MGNDEMKAMLLLVANFGFPGALSIYLLIRFEKRLESLTDAINKLKEVFKE